MKHIFHSLSPEEALQNLSSSPDTGLSSDQIEKLSEQYGENILPAGNEKTWYGVFLAQFQSFLIIILIIAAAVSFFVKDAKDAAIISAAVVLNVIIGFIQEWKAEKSLQALQEVVSPEATVLREGRQLRIAAKDIVPGDIVLVAAGESVPADARLLDSTELECNEAPLTGESTPVQKSIDAVEEKSGIGDRTNMLYFGTQVVKGSATGVVTAIGRETEMGKIAALLSETKDEKTPLQRRLDHFSKITAIIILAVSALIFAIGWFQGLPFTEIFATAIAVAVSAIPEGLVVSVTVILAVGMRRILQKRGLARSLQAAETLGSTSVICTDKTGTITEGKMQVVDVVTADYHFDKIHKSVERHQDTALREMVFVLNIGMLCNDASIAESAESHEQKIIGNFTDQALLRAGLQLGLNHTQLKKDERRIATIPFDSSYKYMATLHKHPKDGKRIYMKGAPEMVLESSTKLRKGASVKELDENTRKEFVRRIQEFTEQGLRTLAFAYTDVKDTQEEIDHDDMQNLVFVGFVGIQDPLRPNISETFERTANAGIRAIMITGDHKRTAQSIAREVGLPAEEHNILTGEELHAMTQEELNARVQDISVYARVSPEDKLNIIQAWKANGKVVAMTGDGVNDAPALKAADIGVALGSGTDVAKGTSDLVLLDDDYTIIVDAVEEGRVMFDNIRKVVLYLLSDSFTEVIVIIGALLFALPLPLTAAQILWINLVADGFPSMALTIEEKEDDVMNQDPRPLSEPILNGEMLWIIGAVSIVTGLLNFWLFRHVLDYSGSVELARTVVFMSIALDSLPFAFSIRSLRHSVFAVSPFSNPWLIVGVGAAFLLQISSVVFEPIGFILDVVPLSAREWGYVAGASVVVVLFTELIKFVYNHSLKQKRV